MDLALGPDELMETLKLEEITDRTWNIQACSAMTKEGKFESINSLGLEEGIKWITDTMNSESA